MPKWGLTQSQIDDRPWGLPPEFLMPAKTVTDPIHKDIYLNNLELLLVDSPAMERLRRVRQLGTTHLVYPGATHTRFAHSLGTQRAAQDLLDAVWNSRVSPHASSLPLNLMEEWKGQGVLEHEFAKATVLARLGGLLHDLCHIPLGHTIEDDLGILTSHDNNEARFQHLWDTGIDPVARDAIESADGLMTELRALIVSKDDQADATVKASQYPFVSDIVGNTICADLIDYLQRDHYYTGLPLALGRRFMDSFFVVNSDHPYYAKRMVIGVERDGRNRNDIVTELLKYLRYRYELTERVLTHHAKTAADAMLGKMLELWHDELLAEASAGREVVTEHAALREEVKGQIENEFISRSDDGLIEHLSTRTRAQGADPRHDARIQIAENLRDRRLYKVLGHAGSRADQANADSAWAKFGDEPADRRALEKAAAEYAGLDHGWEVVLWLPKPTMRFKVADVLVHRDSSIATLGSVEPASSEIVEQHKQLWAVTVYVPAHVHANRLAGDIVLAKLTDETGLTFRRPDGSVVPGAMPLAEATIIDIAKRREDRASERALRQFFARSRSDEGAAYGGRGSARTFDTLLDLMWTHAHAEHLVDAEAFPGRGTER